MTGMSICRRHDEREKKMKYLEPDEKKKPGLPCGKADVPLLLVLALTAAAAFFVYSGDGSRGTGSMAEGEAGISERVSGAADSLYAAEETAAAGEDEEIPEEAEIPFENIMTADSSDLTVTWDGLTEGDQQDVGALEGEIRAALDAFAAEGYTAGFMLYDLNSGGGISYHADEMYYSASAIKGPYVAWLVEDYPQTMDFLYGTIQNTITWSSNDDYGELITTYGYTEFNDWAAGIGCEDLVISGEWYTSVKARDFAKLWCHMYDRVVSGGSLAGIINIYTDTLSSAISETLGGQYTVYSKGGWIGEGRGSYYNVQNDAGIVMKGEHPYVLVILSDAYGRLDLLDNLVYILDQAHTELTETAG